MFKKQKRHNPILPRAISLISITLSFAAMSGIYAQEQHYIYPGELIKAKKSIYPDRPQAPADNFNPYQTRYAYPPPMQKPGSNPFTRHQYSSDNMSNSQTNMTGNHYNYPPPTKKFGSNPFIKPKQPYNTLQRNYSQNSE